MVQNSARLQDACTVNVLSNLHGRAKTWKVTQATHFGAYIFEGYENKHRNQMKNKDERLNEWTAEWLNEWRIKWSISLTILLEFTPQPNHSESIITYSKMWGLFYKTYDFWQLLLADTLWQGYVCHSLADHIFHLLLDLLNIYRLGAILKLHKGWMLIRFYPNPHSLRSSV